MFWKKSKKIKELESERDSLARELSNIREADKRIIKLVEERQLVKLQSGQAFSIDQVPDTEEGIEYMENIVVDGLLNTLRDHIEIDTYSSIFGETTVKASIWVAVKGDQDGQKDIRII